MPENLYLARGRNLHFLKYHKCIEGSKVAEGAHEEITQQVFVLPFVTRIVNGTLEHNILVVRFSIRQRVRIGTAFGCRKEKSTNNLLKRK